MASLSDNSKSGQIVSINISKEKGTPKSSVPQGVVTSEGIIGDVHAGSWHRQVSLLSTESIERFQKVLGREIEPGEFAENITISGVDLRQVALQDRFMLGEVELEVTQIGKSCHGEGCSIFREVGKCVMPQEGIFCRVIKGGNLQPGTAVVYHPASED